MSQPVFMITKVCNNDCVFCAANEPDFPNITLPEIETIFSNNMAGREVVISGKEPTTSDDLPEIVNKLTAKGCQRITIQTNGRRLSNPEFLKKFKGNPVSFFVSIHGDTAEAHEKATSVPGSFEETMQGIKNIVRERFHITTNTVITRLNMHELPLLTEKLFRMGVGFVTLAYVNPSGRITNNYGDYAPRYSEAIKYINESFAISEKYANAGNIQGMPLCYLPGRESYANDATYGDVNEIFAGEGTNFSGNYGRSSLYVKGEPCKNCDYTLFCDGAYTAYTNTYGWDDIKPIKLDQSKVKKEKKYLELDSKFYPTIKMQTKGPVNVASRKFGGFFVYPPVLIPLRKRGFLVLSSLNGQINLEEIQDKFGQDAVAFIADLHQLGFIFFKKEKGFCWQTQGPPIPAVNDFDRNEDLEIPIFGREINYPEVKLI